MHEGMSCNASRMRAFHDALTRSLMHADVNRHDSYSNVFLKMKIYFLKKHYRILNTFRYFVSMVASAENKNESNNRK